MVPAPVRELEEGEESDPSTRPSEPQIFRTPTDIVQLNLDAWEDQYRAAAESGMFVRRKTGIQIKKERIALQIRMKHEKREAAEREKAAAEKQAEDSAPLTAWEEDANTDPEKMFDISELPPSQRKDRDSRIGEGPTFGAEPPAARPERLAWSKRKEDVELTVEEEAKREWDRRYSWKASVKDEDDPPEIRTAALRGDRAYAKRFTERKETRSEPPSSGTESPSASASGSPLSSNSLSASVSASGSSFGAPLGTRSYSTARVMERRSGSGFGLTQNPSSSQPRPNPMRAASVQHLDPATKLAAYREQVAATFVPNRRQKYMKEGGFTGEFTGDNHRMQGLPGEFSSSPTRPCTDACLENQPKAEPWEPAKKLTYDAMAGLKALYKNDPQTWTVGALSHKFGISWEAVRRILKSNWQERKVSASKRQTEAALEGTKWGKSPSTATIIDRAYAKSRAEGRDRRTGTQGDEAEHRAYL